MASDDYSPRPHAPALDWAEIPEDETVAVDDVKLSQAYFHPAWEAVEKDFIDQIEANSQPVDEKLEAAEYKIESIARARYVGFLKGQLVRVKDAVRAVESSKADGAK